MFVFSVSAPDQNEMYLVFHATVCWRVCRAFPRYGQAVVAQTPPSIGAAHNAEPQQATRKQSCRVGDIAAPPLSTLLLVCMCPPLPLGSCVPRLFFTRAAAAGEAAGRQAHAADALAGPPPACVVPTPPPPVGPRDGAFLAGPGVVELIPAAAGAAFGPDSGAGGRGCNA